MVSTKEAQFLINHLFLPPQLPQKDDQKNALDKALLKLVSETLGDFGQLVPPEKASTVEKVKHSIEILTQQLGEQGGLDEKQLLQQLEAISEDGHAGSKYPSNAVLPVYVAAQNACLLVSQVDDRNSLVVEAFELAPRNQNVMSTSGRLRRAFPGPALHIQRQKFQDRELIYTLASTLAKMSTQEARSMHAMVRKSGNTLQEIRDTTDPALVTELVCAFLAPLGFDTGTECASIRIQKQTREDVLWDDSYLPWRRSPLWLLVRVVMHLSFCRALPGVGAADNSNGRDYKLFMVFLLSTVLAKTLPLQLPSDTYYSMSAKISRRLTKMKLAGTEDGLGFVRDTLSRTNDRLETRWLATQRQEEARFSLSALQNLHFSEDNFLTLPSLDNFFVKLLKEQPRNDSGSGLCKVSPAKSLCKFARETLPRLSQNPAAISLAYNLQELERWVSHHLEDWIKDRLGEPTTCKPLYDLMKSYYTAANTAYKGNPEAISLMLLTLLELWVALDRSATSLFPLLKDYNPGFPLHLLQQLLLPRKEDMARIHRAEIYLHARQSQAQHGTAGSIFCDFGTPDCFAVRYVAQSPKHQDLQKAIETEATAARNQKVDDLKQKKRVYDSLIKRRDRLSCKYIEGTNRLGVAYRHHDHGCERCSLEVKASDMKIKVHEWPLPTSGLAAMTVVFELIIPAEFACWREATLWLLLGPLGGQYLMECRGGTKVKLAEYKALRKYRKGTDMKRVELVSNKKPHMVSHRKSVKVGHAHVDDVCLNNGHAFGYYDDGKGFACYTSVITYKDDVKKQCTYELPQRSQALEPFLKRSFGSDGTIDATANMVVSRQSSCPDHLPLAEYRCLAAMLVGHRLPWFNLLVQLAAPTVDFKKIETTLMVLQGIYQAGPPTAALKTKTEVEHDAAEALAICRDAHSNLADDSFISALLAAVNQSAERIEQNWESLQALHLYVLIVQRVLSCLPNSSSSPSGNTDAALGLLGHLRQTVFRWVGLLEAKSHESTDAAQKTFFAQKAVDAALVCTSTLDVDDAYLAGAVAERSNAVILIRCGILVHDKGRPSGSAEASPKQESAPHLDGIVRWWWQRLSHRVYPYLRNQIVCADGTPETTTTCLDEVVRESWPGYRSGDGWRVLSSELDYWVTTETQPLGSAKPAVVHYCILTGELLVNGLPLSRLPASYEGHSSYRALFANIVFQIFPSVVPGHTFTAKERFSGHALHFGRGADEHNDFMVRADKDEGGPWHLVPPRVFESHLPHSLVADCVHWYNAETEVVAFREKCEPWSDTATTWFLKRQNVLPQEDVKLNETVGACHKDAGITASVWRLVKQDQATLICPNSPTGKALRNILAPLQPGQHVNIVLDAVGQRVDVDLPRLHVSFHIQAGTTAVRSRQCKGFTVDTSQALGTLVGLRKKLVLRKEATGERVVMVPPGRVSYSRTEDGSHVAVDIDTLTRPAPGASSVHIFRVNDLLGRLDHNGSMYGHLALAYLHALTSSCLPDPLTHFTGTEQALTILRGAAVASSRTLTAGDVEQLSRILDLAPKADFYPVHAKVMQTVTWNPKLWPLAQHPGFYDAVVALFEQHKETRLYFSKNDFAEPPNVASTFRFPQLLRRLAGRSVAFRTAGFGAEASSQVEDAVYASRHVGQASDRFQRALTASSMLAEQHMYTNAGTATTKLSLNMAQTVWATFTSQGIVQGPLNPDVTWQDLAYDSRWLQDHPEHWARLWCWIHSQTRAWGNGGCGQHQELLRMWLTTMAFANGADMDMVRAMAGVVTAKSMQVIAPPNLARLDLARGHDFDRKDVQSLIDAHLQSFLDCPENNIPAKLDESEEDTARRRQTAYKKNKEQAVREFIRQLQAQWPCHDPAPPTDCMPGAKTYFDVAGVMAGVRSAFKGWFENRQLFLYLKDLAAAFCQLPTRDSPRPHLDWTAIDLSLYERPKSSVEPDDLFSHLPCLSPPKLPPSPDPTVLADILAEKPQQILPDKTETNVMAAHNAQLDELVCHLTQKAASAYEQDYAQELAESLQKLREERRIVSENGEGTNGGGVGPHNLLGDQNGLQHVLKAYGESCEAHVNAVFSQIRDHIFVGLGEVGASRLRQHHGPRISFSFLVQQLSHLRWNYLPATRRRWVVAFGLALTAMQRARRLVQYAHSQPLRLHDLQRELLNGGHTNWKPHLQPDTLIMEIEGNLLVRPVQASIARKMREPAPMQNTVMQLNMGEGKSSVIAPVVVAALADGSRLVRVIVAKAQSQQMHHMLVAKLGGLVNRRVFHLPFSRALRLTEADAETIFNTCVRCQRSGGALLVQPEHILSFQLMGLECLVNGKASVAAGLLRTQYLFNTTSRDIVDESDENFSVKFELIYTMGQQRSVEFAPDRWATIQAVLDVVHRHVDAVRAAYPQSIEVDARHAGSFPRLRVYDSAAMDLLLHKAAREICDAGLPGLPVTHQGPAAREAVYRYITEAQPCAKDVATIESGILWAPASRNYLLLLRGLFARGILFFIFGQKRWRVHYGLDHTREPPTMLAVPFRAKDNPSPRSEFSHPDVVIALTCTSYYYQGLSNEDMSLAFDHLVKSDQADAEYNAWVKGADGLAPTFRNLMGVNLQDRFQCESDIFPSFRYTKRTIDYFLQTVVFSRQMREFPQKLSASGWDIGAAKAHPTTGFSGTIDSRRVLPLDVHYLDLVDQKHTNALVLDHLLRPESGVLYLPGGARGDGPSVAETLVRLAVDQDDARLRVILDVGAQILEWTNAQVAEEWLQLERQRESCKAAKTATPVEAAVFFNDREELVVLDYRGRTESLHTSPYADQLDACVIFLDEAHTRGTDFRLPTDYRAMVTLGASLTKDRLVQACMRMRGLGRGQSVVFCIPEEIRIKINAMKASPSKAGTAAAAATASLSASCSKAGSQGPADDIRVFDVLDWSISETHHDLRKSMPLWSVQGKRFERQRLLWEAAQGKEAGIHMSDKQATAFLEDEAQTLQSLYLPRQEEEMAGEEETRETTTPTSSVDANSADRLAQIHQRCCQVAGIDFNEAALHEEQERELSPEFEQERQVQRPAPADPAEHSLHPHIVDFACGSGVLPEKSQACLPAFESLSTLSAAKDFDVKLFPRDLLVTADFANTVKVSQTQKRAFHSDAYQRPVQWLLARHGSEDEHWTTLVIISPFEANALLPMIRGSNSTNVWRTASLHLYTPRPNLEVPSLERLDLFTVWPSSLTMLQKPPSPSLSPPPPKLISQLNLFSGQLYFDGCAAYRDLCAMLRLSDQKAGAGTDVATDGFLIRAPAGSAAAAVIARSSFPKSPVRFIKQFLSHARKDSQAFDKTHLGRVLDGELLLENDF